MDKPKPNFLVKVYWIYNWLVVKMMQLTVFVAKHMFWVFVPLSVWGAVKGGGGNWNPLTVFVLAPLAMGCLFVGFTWLGCVGAIGIGHWAAAIVSGISRIFNKKSQL